MSELVNICDQISTFLEQYQKNDNIEVEVKFRDITKEVFKVFLSHLKKTLKYSKIHSLDMYSGDKRYSFVDDNYYETSKKELLRHFITINDRLLKFTVSEEKNKLLKNQPVKTFDFSRRKDRYRFKINNFYIDLTEVYVDREMETSYEIEIEVVDQTKYSSKDFSSIIDKYLKVISINHSNLIRFCNLCLSDGKSKDNEKITWRFVSRPRDLLKIDVTEPNSILNNYAVSVKADGVPYFLVFYIMKIFLISSKPEIKPIFIGQNNNKSLNNSLFSGELIDREDFTDKSYTDFSKVFLVYDTITIGNKNVSSKNYDIRFSYIQRINDLEIKEEGVKKIKILEKKIFILGDNSEEFYKNFRKCYEEKKKVFFKDDGYIFTPIESPYITEGQIQRRNIKSLSKFKDVCKFKPIEKRSIDFIVYDGMIHYVKIDKKGLKHPKSFKKMKYSLDFPEDLNDKIVEFFPVMEDGNIVSLEPRRIRYDKSQPNNEDVVEEIYKSYTENNPITEDTLLEKDTILMRAYNGKIKKNLIDSLKDYVIDIGSGKGGDISKFGKNKKILKVLSVEPDKNFTKEFKERLSNTRFPAKFQLLDGVKGEDGYHIVRGMNFFPTSMRDKDLNITFMASLSYFWKSESDLEKLVKTLRMIREEYKKRGGNKNINFVYFTIDGYKVFELFKKHDTDDIKLNTISLKFDGLNTLEVDIPDSKTAKNLEEYLVKLDQLFVKLSMKNIMKKDERVPKNYLMSEAERTYIGLWSSGSAGMPLIQISKDLSLERIYVDTEEGIEKDGIVLAGGEDTVEEIKNIGNDYFRVGTLDFNLSAIHSILKLIDEKYRSTDIYQRMRMAEDIASELDDPGDLTELSKYFNIGIKYFKGEESKNFGDKYGTMVYLNKCRDGSYEPVVLMNSDEVRYVFHKFDN